MGRATHGVRRVVAATVLLGYLLAIASPARAQQRALRKPVLVFKEEQACMDMEETKQFLMVYKHYTVLLDARAGDLRQLALAREHIAECKVSTSNWRNAFKNMKAAHAIAEKQRDAAILEREQLKKWSVKDGALPWVAAALVGAFVAGVLVAK